MSSEKKTDDTVSAGTTTIRRMRVRHSSIETSAVKIDAVARIAAQYQSVARQAVHERWSPLFVASCLGSSFDFAAEWRRSHDRSETPLLSAHVLDHALYDAHAVLSGSWHAGLASVRSAAARRWRDGFVDEPDPQTGKPTFRIVESPQRHEIFFLLCWPVHVAAILRGEVIDPTALAGIDPATAVRFSANDHAAICRWLRRVIRAKRPGQPSLRHRLSFEADPASYRLISIVPAEAKSGGRSRSGGRSSGRSGAPHFSAYVSLVCPERGKRLLIPLAGKDAGKGASIIAGPGNLRIDVETDTRGRQRIAFRKAVKVEVVLRTGAEEVGTDKGSSIAITATSSDAEHAVFLGKDSWKALSNASDKSFRRGRSRFRSQADNLAGRTTKSGRFHGNPKPTKTEARKAAQIRKHNLHSKRRDNETRRAHAEIDNINGRASRELTEAFPNAAQFREERLNFQSANQEHRPPGVNRKLNRWAKGNLSTRMGLHIEASGARRGFVNAAHTSRECPRCHWTTYGNRKATSFRCSHCEHHGHADAIAAQNVLTRGRDEEIALWMSKSAVKSILLGRHASSDCGHPDCAGQATDGRCPSRGPDHQPAPEVPGSGRRRRAAPAAAPPPL